MLGYLVVAAFAIYYLMPKPITGPSSVIPPVPVSNPKTPQQLMDEASQKAQDYLAAQAENSSVGSSQATIPKNGVVDLFAVPANSH